MQQEAAQRGPDGPRSVSTCFLSDMGFDPDFPPTTVDVWGAVREAGMLCSWKTPLRLLRKMRDVSPGEYFWVVMEPVADKITGLYRVFGLERDQDGTPALYAYALLCETKWSPHTRIRLIVSGDPD